MKLAFASDFDNTIFFKSGFKDEDLIAIKDFQEKGNLFGVCTGRSMNGVVKTTDNKIKYDFYILATGAIILDRELNPLYLDPISKDDCFKLRKTYENTHHFAYITRTDFVVIDAKYKPAVIVSSYEEIESDVYGISFQCGSEEEAKRLKTEIEKDIPGLNCHVNKFFLDINKKGNSKGNSLKKLKSLLSLDKVAAIGDSYNDITMLENADKSYTFNSSPEIVKKEADVLVDSVSEALFDYIK